MKEISQEEFEVEIEKLIAGEITKQELTKKLKTGLKTLNRKIDELEKINPELYKKVVRKIPYVPRDIEIDIESLAISVIRYGREETAESVGISIRTISRKIKELKNLNPDLYALYQIRNKRMTKKQRERYMLRVDELDKNIRPERSGLKEREQEIRNVLSQFETLVANGMLKRDAAQKLGYAGYPSIWNMYRDLERIQTAKKMKASVAKESKEAVFRKEMKVEGITGEVSLTEENTTRSKVIETERR